MKKQTNFTFPKLTVRESPSAATTLMLAGVSWCTMRVCVCVCVHVCVYVCMCACVGGGGIRYVSISACMLSVFVVLTM